MIKIDSGFTVVDKYDIAAYRVSGNRAYWGGLKGVDKIDIRTDSD
jgi:hypothetical protein